MSKATVLEFGSDQNFRNLAFPDLEARFAQHLDLVRSVTDLDRLIKAMKPLFSDERYTSEEILRLRKLRQRAYDRKRNVQICANRSVSEQIKTPRSVVPDIPAAKPIIKTETRTPRPREIKRIHSTLPSATDCAGMALSSFGIDSKNFIAAIPKLLLWFLAATAVSFFVWKQSLSLYSAAGFADSAFTAAGGLLMILGFAAYYSISRSWLALLLCLYAGAYESYLMVSGTIHEDKLGVNDGVQNNPELIFSQEKADKERARYQELKQRYDDPESKVFRNAWFLKTSVNPAWEANTKAHEEYAEKRSALITAATSNQVTWLKIFYRLGLVFLCMISVHQFFVAFGAMHFRVAPGLEHRDRMEFYDHHSSKRPTVAL